jgi:hypothetical protein
VAQEPDWSGLRRDTYYFLGYQFVGIAFLYVMPESVTNWSDEDREEYDLERWRDNVSNPQWDTDDWWINYLLHPYWGAAYFVRGRERGLGGAGGFLYSTLLSSLYELGAEALFERPSIQDMIVTPVLGSVLGAYFMTVRQRIFAAPEEAGLPEQAILVLTDPLGAINGVIDRWLGEEAELRLGLAGPALLPALDDGYRGWHGAAPPLRLDDPTWGLELRVRW